MTLYFGICGTWTPDLMFVALVGDMNRINQGCYVRLLCCLDTMARSGLIIAASARLFVACGLAPF